MNQAVIAFFLLCLDDEDGVSEEAYEALANAASFFPDYLTPILDQVHATDGRFYLKEGVADELAQGYTFNLDDYRLTS